MAGIGGSDKSVVTDIQQWQQVAKTLADFIGIGFGRDFGLGGFFGDFTTVLIGAGSI